jgi:hypothetical protein
VGNPQLRDPIHTMLESGPYQPIELLDHLGDITTWIDDDEFDDDDTFAIQKMLERVEERDGIMIPHWWQGTVQEFIVEFNENYEPNYRANSIWGKPWTSPERQLQILETVPDLWRQERDRNRERGAK